MKQSPDATAIDRLLDIMKRLRDPDTGCPWDVEQNFATIAPYTIEEAYEVADAIDRGDMTDLRDELGDLLLQVVFHARMAEEEGTFDFADVATQIGDKMVRRHPHVFGDETVSGAAAQTLAWEEQKAQERASKAGENGDSGTLDGLPVALPALTRAAKLQKRAARIGFDWPDTAPVAAKVEEELNEIRDAIASGLAHERLEEEIGDLLFAAVNLARHLHVDPESALRRANGKFERRFRSVERQAAANGQSVAALDLQALDALWDQAKSQE